MKYIILICFLFIGCKNENTYDGSEYVPHPTYHIDSFWISTKGGGGYYYHFLKKDNSDSEYHLHLNH
jgi:hypothetical protein